jgi:hypothetical protein
MDLIVCTESPKSRLTKSADGSIAKDTELSRSRMKKPPIVSLDKMCLLMEVREFSPMLLVAAGAARVREPRALDRDEAPLVAFRAHG